MIILRVMYGCMMIASIASGVLGGGRPFMQRPDIRGSFGCGSSTPTDDASDTAAENSATIHSLRNVVCGSPSTVGASVAGAGGPGTYAHYQFNGTTPGGQPTASASASMVEVLHTWKTMPKPSQKNGNAVFASMQVFFEGGQGGYFGTQVWREPPNATRPHPIEKHTAIWSYWDLPNATVTGIGPNCARFGGEGVGSHCVLDYHLVQGKTYSVRVEMTAANSSGAIYGASIGEVATASSPATRGSTKAQAAPRTTIGHLYFPNVGGYKGFGNYRVVAAAFQEYFLATGCEGQPESECGLTGPSFYLNGNGEGGGSGKSIVQEPVQATSDYAHNNCSHVDVTHCAYGGSKCVLLRAGGNIKSSTAAGTPLWSN